MAFDLASTHSALFRSAPRGRQGTRPTLVLLTFAGNHPLCCLPVLEVSIFRAVVVLSFKRRFAIFWRATWRVA